jgi:SAM-dependent methyltransferase
MIQPAARPEAAFATEEVPVCPVCQQPGPVVYDRLPDRLFHTPGLWRFRACADQAGCGTYWMDPRPTLKEIGRAYESYMTHAGDAGGSLADRLLTGLRGEYLAHTYGYATGGLPRLAGRAVAALTHLLPGLRSAFDVQVRGLQPGPGQRLLDVGCGAGRDLALLRELGWVVEGVEVDPASLRVARDRGLTVHQGTLAEQAFAADSFDVVAMSHVIEHLHQPQAVLRECFRILRRGGRLIVATPNARGMLHRKYREYWLALDPPRHLILFTQDSLGALITQGGFSRVKTRTTVHNAFAIDYSSRFIQTTGRYEWGQLPAFPRRIASQLAQAIAPTRIALGHGEGDELFTLAFKP